jgi:hypothetical protein
MENAEGTIQGLRNDVVSFREDCVSVTNSNVTSARYSVCSCLHSVSLCLLSLHSKVLRTPRGRWGWGSGGGGGGGGGSVLVSFGLKTVSFFFGSGRLSCLCDVLRATQAALRAELQSSVDTVVTLRASVIQATSSIARLEQDRVSVGDCSKYEEGSLECVRVSMAE